MKRSVLLLLFLATLTTYAQTEVDTQWATEINNVFQNIEKNRIPHGILLDYAMEFTDIPSYKGNLTDSTYIDVGVLSNIYKTLYMGQVTTDTTDFPQLKNYARAWLDERRAQNLGNIKTLTIGGLYYQYSQMKETALNDNEINVNPLSRRYSDKYINGVWQNPYKTSQTIAFAPPVSTMDQQNFQVVIPSNLFLSNAQGNILSIQIDFEDGLGYRTIDFDNPISVNYRRNGIYTWTFRILKTGRETLHTQSKIRIEAQAEGGSSSRTIDNTVEIAGPGYNGGAILSIDYAPGNGTTLMKPLIVAEGFDPGNVLAPESLSGINDLDGFNLSLLNAGSNLRNLIDLESQSRQYDIVYVDWKNGTAAIQDNSITLRNVINYINSEKVGNEPNVLLGQSMGGVIGRYTLATMENDTIDHDVRLFISHDAPMQGSNTPIGIQHFTRHALNAFTSIPILQGLDITLSLAADIIDFWESTTAMDINAGFIDPYISPTHVLTIQDTPAAVQLNYHWVTPGEQAITLIHDQWQNSLDIVGYPQNSRNIAISNGNECATDHGFVAGDEFIDILDLDNPDFWGDLLSLVAVPAGGVLLFDPGLIGLGLIPGSSEWKFDFDIYSTPDVFDFNKEVYRGRVQYTKKVLWLFPVTHTLTGRDKDAPSGFFPYGSFTGGQLPGGISGILDDVPLPLSVDIVNNNYGFIPTASSLDVKRNNGDLPLIDDHERKYGGGNIDYSGLNSEFDNFIVDYNTFGAK
ncbi:hypothetical protein [uncultured Dokdonia sp.]|uniref:lipase/acyltransferase domain-containing protein n=1 Tax=uncultured Dokdonia sp. TaxID=575653 RepID=UPI00261378BE|nr:hypothetical protein [uncultured Dokdonia sp.]